ncbi:MAG: bacterial cell division rane protein [Candidatus Saccharibacteria bacterium]|nr:bacterial cell division rane protein [Candidatus Saccharibacteria bacterium]
MRTAAVSSRTANASVGNARRHRPDYQIVLFMGLLMMLGLIVMYAIGPQRANVLNNSFGTDYTNTYFFIKQTVSLLLALGAFVAMAAIPYRIFRDNAIKILWAGFIACAVLAVAGWLHLGIAQESLGATRWFNLGPLGSLQPAEFLKFGMLLFAAGFLGMRAQQGLINDLHKTLIPTGAVVLAAIIFVIGIQEDMGTGLALIAILVAMLVAAGVRLQTLGMVGLIGLGLMVLMIVIAPHRVERITTFLQGDTTNLSDGSNYHIIHAKIAIGSGGFLGVGIGNSIQATGYLPEAINDSVFAIMGETFGFVGLVVIILLFTALLLRLINVADHLEDMRLRLIVVGVFGWLGAHVILNIAAMIGVFPLTGITLPLLSFGGTSMIFIAAALGLAFQLSRYTNFTSRVKETGYEDSRSRRRVGRSRHASSRSY